MRDLNDLSFFAAVVSNGGISAASRALGLPKSRISRRVTALEDQLGVRLLERSTRRFKITEAGEDVYRHARAALSEAEAIDEAVSRLKAEPQGLVRVACPLGIDRLLAASLQDFLAEHRKLRLQFVVTNRRVAVIETRLGRVVNPPRQGEHVVQERLTPLRDDALEVRAPHVGRHLRDDGVQLGVARGDDRIGHGNATGNCRVRQQEQGEAVGPAGDSQPQASSFGVEPVELREEARRLGGRYPLTCRRLACGPCHTGPATARWRAPDTCR